MPERVVTVPGLRDRRNFFRAGRTKRTSQLGGAMLSCRGCPFRCPLTGDVPHDSAAPADLQPFAGPVFPICPHDSSCDGWQRPHPRGEDLTNVGVLLYYSYTPISDIEAAVQWHLDLCEHLALKGRIRISPEGVNVVLDGGLSDLELFKRSVDADSRWGTRIDYKISGLNPDKPASHQRFRDLSVKPALEVVSIGLGEGVANAKDGARHLTPEEWHAALVNRGGDGKSVGSASGAEPEVVLLDARNLYESRIGRFEAPGAVTVLPPIRQFTQFPRFVDDNLDNFRGKKILMYCTGGVRCERASAYLQARLAERPAADGAALPHSEVLQLRGGIHSYLKWAEAEGRKIVDMAEGHKSFFAGKNFVFDPRRFEPMHDKRVVGQCAACGAPHDDYDNGPEQRCPGCRFLLLLCDPCRGGGAAGRTNLFCGLPTCPTSARPGVALQAVSPPPESST